MCSTPFEKTISDGRFRPGLSAPRAMAWLVALILNLSGCALPERVTVDDAGTLQYERAVVVYELSGANGALEHDLLRTVRRPELHAADSATWSSAMLTIDYPHPCGRTDLAQATLHLSDTLIVFRETSPTPGEQIRTGLIRAASFVRQDESDPQDAWAASATVLTLDVPKYQLDLLLYDLADSGFFDAQQRPSAGSRLAVRVDRGELKKAWSPEPRLDDFVTRTYRHGRVVR